MENSLRKTIIRIQDDIELMFWKLIKFHKFGCKAMFYRKNQQTIYDVTVLSKSLLQLNNFSEAALMNIKRYQHMNSKIVCSIFCITEDPQFIYIISGVTQYRMSDLVHKREGLTQFQIVYFLLDLIEIINYLKSRNSFYQLLDIDEIYLTSNMKISIPFSIWITPLNFDKPMSLRNEDKKAYICPEILKPSSTNIVVDGINSWNIGVFLYELAEGKKPFLGKGENNSEVTFTRNLSPQLQSFIKKLLIKNPGQRLKYNLILVDNLLKKYTSLPHILPSTIFSCPPSGEYITQYDKKFYEPHEENYMGQTRVFNVKTVFQFEKKVQNKEQQNSQIKSFNTIKYIKPTEWNLTDTFYFVSEFADISENYGYGYQMNYGLVCFVFNDGSEIKLENGKKSILFTNEKKVSNELRIENISEDGEMKKKVDILEAYTKSIKKFRPSIPQTGKPVVVNHYSRTSCASIFMLTNLNIQITFTDKMTILMSKNNIYVNNKGLEKFELYEDIPQTNDLCLRKKYALTMANKLFHWNLEHLDHQKYEENT